MGWQMMLVVGCKIDRVDLLWAILWEHWFATLLFLQELAI